MLISIGVLTIGTYLNFFLVLEIGLIQYYYPTLELPIKHISLVETSRSQLANSSKALCPWDSHDVITTEDTWIVSVHMKCQFVGVSLWTQAT